MTRLIREVLLIALFGIVLGLIANQASPRGLPLITPPKRAAVTNEFLELSQAKEFWQTGAAMFLDAREPADYAAGHIGNALNLPAQSFERHFGELAPLLTTESRLIL